MKLIVALLSAFALGQRDPPEWLTSFSVEKSSLTNSGRSDYFILEPGYKLEYVGGDERLVITVLNETERVDGVETRVVEERETKGGKLVEVSRNFFAIQPESGNVYYFGEDVDMYKNGKVTSHEGAWRSGVNGAKFGLMMPGKPRLGLGYYQEYAPKVAMDRAKVMGYVDIKTAAGSFPNALWTEETTPLEPDAKEFKYYAKGIGLIKDGDLELVKKPATAPGTRMARAARSRNSP